MIEGTMQCYCDSEIECAGKARTCTLGDVAPTFAFIHE
jgi:hypothetical protein